MILDTYTRDYIPSVDEYYRLPKHEQDRLWLKAQNASIHPPFPRVYRRDPIGGLHIIGGVLLGIEILAYSIAAGLMCVGLFIMGFVFYHCFLKTPRNIAFAFSVMDKACEIASRRPLPPLNPKPAPSAKPSNKPGSKTSPSR